MSVLGSGGNESESAAPIGVYLALSALSLLFNGTFLLVLWHTWTFVKGRRITYHVTNLAISDTIVGASTFSHYISFIAAGWKETALTSAFTVIVWTASLTSLLAVCLMAIERAVCIKKPHTWKKILPLKRMLMVMAGNWILTLILAIIMHFHTMTMMFILLVLFCIAVFVTTVVYTVVYVEIWRTKPSEVYHHETQQSSVEAIRARRQRSIRTFVLILTLLLLVTVMPSFINLAVKKACELFELNCSFIATVTMLSRYFYMMEILNFVVNPIIYVWRISMYRKAFWKCLKRLRNSISSSQERNQTTDTLSRGNSSL